MAWPRRFLGLPLHPMLVHFPLVCWLSMPVFDAMALVRGPDPWWGIALGMTAIGVVIGALALTTGLLEYIHLSETGSNNVRLAAEHGIRNTVIWCVQLGKLIAAIWVPAGGVFIAACLVVDVLSCALLVQSAWFGTRIAYGG
ncbi:MAG: DUF2231 domain-containing protein [Rhodanobacteraceae bacterium]